MSLDCTTRFYSRCTFGRFLCSAKKMACYVRGSVPLQANNGAKFFFCYSSYAVPIRLSENRCVSNDAGKKWNNFSSQSTRKPGSDAYGDTFSFGRNSLFGRMLPRPDRLSLGSHDACS